MDKIIKRYDKLSDVSFKDDSKDCINIHIVDVRDFEIESRPAKPGACTKKFAWEGDFTFGDIDMYKVRKDTGCTSHLFLIVDDNKYVDVVWNMKSPQRFGGFVSTEEQFNSWLNMEVLK